jgi:uncharacterized coiled-coil protein SlyX
MNKVTHKITELEQSKAFFEDAGKNLNASLTDLRNQGKQDTQVYREQKKRYLKTIKLLYDIKRFLRQWDKMHLEHV